MASFSNFKSTIVAASNEVAGVSAGVTIYATRDNLPSSGNEAGDQAYVTGNNRLYIWNGSGWYNVALLNVAPAISSVLDSDGGTTPFALSTEGATTRITITAADSDGDPITYEYSADSNFSGLATISQDSSVFTITPFSEDSATTESGTITFTATDGVNIASSGVQTFTLQFTINWSWESTGSMFENNSKYAGSYEQYIRAVAIDPTATYVTAGGNSYNLHSYTLGTPGNLTTAVYQSSFTQSQAVRRYSGIDWNNDGSEFYTMDYTYNTIQRFSVSTNYVVGTSPTLITASSALIPTGTTALMGLHIKPDGTRFWVCGFGNTTIYEFILNTPWDISSISGPGTLNIGNTLGSPTDIRWNTDGTQMIILMQNTDDFVIYEPSTPWSFSGAYPHSHIFSPGGNLLGFGFDIDETGTIVIAGSADNSGYLRKYTVTLS